MASGLRRAAAAAFSSSARYRPRAAIQSSGSVIHPPTETIYGPTVDGCDRNHWVVTMNFPKDPAPSPEEMVETYVQTLAKVVGSVEEAKKRMYACSTTNSHRFHAELTEELTQKFNGMEGVDFVMLDSYHDMENKEYGGDKYVNGVITPRSG